MVRCMIKVMVKFLFVGSVWDHAQCFLTSWFTRIVQASDSWMQFLPDSVFPLYVMGKSAVAELAWICIFCRLLYAWLQFSGVLILVRLGLSIACNAEIFSCLIGLSMHSLPSFVHILANHAGYRFLNPISARLSMSIKCNDEICSRWIDLRTCSLIGFKILNSIPARLAFSTESNGKICYCWIRLHFLLDSDSVPVRLFPVSRTRETYSSWKCPRNWIDSELWNLHISYDCTSINSKMRYFKFRHQEQISPLYLPIKQVPRNHNFMRFQ